MDNLSKIIKRFFIGVKRGFTTPTVPIHIIKLQKNVFIRILRVLGGISIILILTKRLEMFGSYSFPALCVCLVISFMFSLYLIYITGHRIIHIYKNVNSKDLDIRNSPYDKFATYAARLIWCGKGLCEVAAPIGVTYGAMAGIDELRKLRGLEPIFLPFVANILLPDSEADNIFKQQRQLSAALVRNDINLNYAQEEWKMVNTLEHSQIISKTEATEWKDIIQSNRTQIFQNNKHLKSNILENLEKFKEISKK